jgi:hypothetical protein
MSMIYISFSKVDRTRLDGFFDMVNFLREHTIKTYKALTSYKQVRDK